MRLRSIGRNEGMELLEYHQFLNERGGVRLELKTISRIAWVEWQKLHRSLYERDGIGVETENNQSYRKDRAVEAVLIIIQKKLNRCWN